MILTLTKAIIKFNKIIERLGILPKLYELHIKRKKTLKVKECKPAV